eukprot:CAMPEP_0181122776 /NCGR_PEP_ID=MMETSP1071-20121207/25506_1 /TAXON_ID=35127 /ORGANISM="Thalassiosira sp., Strain NH16" /LENGTH=475 /DNA_ID=CAMNT_0023207793 /DNA_START=27 /DNA_END=1454 /DNA_ORIENTATION=+
MEVSALSSIGAPASIALLLALIAVGYAILSHTLRRNDSRKYPPFAPGGVWGNLRRRLASGAAFWMLDLANELETRVFQIEVPFLPPKSLVVVGELAPFRAILTDPLSKKPRLYTHFRSIFGGNRAPTMFTMNGSGHHEKRKAVAPAFSSNHIKRMNKVALDKTEEWIKNTLTNTTGSFDVSKEMIGIVVSALSETAFEYDMTDEEKQIFGDDLKLTLREFTRKGPVIPLRRQFGFLVPERRRAVAAAQNLNDLARKILNAYRNKTTTVKGTIIQLIEDSDAFPTEDEKLAQLLEFLVAGHDTTAYSIAFTLIELAKRPDEQTKLRESLSRLSPENWSSCEQLKRVVKESMRLKPVGRSVRESGSDVMTSKKEVIPKGSFCQLNFAVLFRNPDIFDDPDSFEPSRWENPTKEMMDAVTPFSLGKQNCVGQSLAKVEMFGIIARICSEFELTLECEGILDFSLTVKPVGTRLIARKV